MGGGLGPALFGFKHKHNSPAGRVPSPMQITVTSENFKTVLHWQYPPMSETPRFTVEIKPYNLGYYKVVSTCVNISAHFCDLSREIHEPFASHWLRVKAVVGSQQSEYVETNEFILQKHGKIGPPKLNLSRHGDKIMVDIYHPAFPSVELLPWIGEIYSEIMYLVTFGDSKNQSKEEFPEDNCTMYKCSVNIPVPAEGSTYCVSAKGTLYGNLMVGASSEESCIDVPLKQTLSTEYIVILCVAVLSLTVMFTVCFGCKKLRKSNIKLPKSLVSVIRNLNTEGSLEPKSEVKYMSVISFVPGQSVLPQNVDVTSLEAEPKEETASPENSSQGASSVLPPEAPAEAEEVSVPESTEEVSSDDEQNHKVRENYFISDSSQMNICSNSSAPEVPATEIQQTVVPSSCLKFSGYDKPHVPLDMLIDVGEEQPVIAYRPTE
ncbi:interferon gamma receptor 1 isoform X2 [Strigops habroptila]|uniref:interferon gamma receptor 1 isoform X2 n=1 Tax=Strigops habroptila TaxID=2489341 RepID=UPI0011CFBA96|nr:interferon gamma receptor 1 isoform X2 [Strigops habroptila]